MTGGERTSGVVLAVHRALPDLVFVPAEDVLLHEECDPERVARLCRRLQQEGVLKNPPVAARLESRVVVLDGANRTEALRTLGARTILLQQVDYEDPAVELRTWRHLVTDAPPDLERRLRELLPLERMESREAAQALEQGRILAYLRRPGGTLVLPRGADLPEDVARLRELVSLYKGAGRIHRVLSEDPERLAGEYGEAGMLVAFPTFTKREILEMAHNGVKLPTGITRHVIPGRALRVNMPLERMLREESLQALQMWLHSWMREKVRNHEVRYYAESTFLFDE
ncbi:MAG: hypothetical protein QN172_01375 [Armatimonadota bacterium]|nr:hypothetical protein [Armatimonadota bacterium]MDR7440478.1 hypothetical protein [Armatimonadota bacterium]MDR7562084.1 hypothetical protein [Armatimonadota bacterium]MDR7568821.1 hypothetical protein [Armatimonadota bacterium]MDR7601089.1 hypothetical protein [Armatimonadota bacterium]